MSHSYGRILFVLAGIALAVYFAWKVAQRMDAFLFPWADEKSGRPVLVGNWVGTVTDARALQAELRRRHEDRNHPCSDCQIIEGVARTCDADGTVVTYRVSGVPLDRAAKRIRLRLSPQGYQGMIDAELVGATGEWDGATLRFSLQTRDEQARIRVEMQREQQGSFQRACELLGASTPLSR